jgi:alcohol dehydrogenase
VISPPTPFSGEFHLPRLEHVIAGPDTLERLAGELDRYRCHRALIVTGPTLGASPLVGRVRRALGERWCATFTGVRQHVPAGTVGALVGEVRDRQADCLVSLGGGSAIDTAKAAAHTRLAHDASGELVQIAIPTTLSAGEFTDVAGVTDERTRIKRAIRHPRIAPRTVIADAAIACQTPDALWAASGMRALDHAIETLYSRRHHPIAQPLAVRAIEMLVEHLPRSVAAEGGSAGVPGRREPSVGSGGPSASAEPTSGPGDRAPGRRLAHRGECQMAAWLAVFGVTNAGFGLSHALGHQIGPRWGVLHGVTSAIVLPHAMRFMAAAAADRFAPIAGALGVPFEDGHARECALACADAVAAFVARFGLPQRLRDVGVPHDDLPAVAAHVSAVMTEARVVERAIGAADVEAVLAFAY